MTLTVLQAILDQFLESDCRFSIRIIINDVWSVLDKTFLKDPIILSFKRFLDLQPVQSFQILSFIQETLQEYLGCRVNTQFMRRSRAQQSKKEVFIQLWHQRCQKLPQLGLQLVCQQL